MLVAMRSKLIAALVSFGFLATGLSTAVACPYEDSEKAAAEPKIAKKDASKKMKKAPSKKAQARRAAVKKAKARPAPVAKVASK